MFIVKKTISGNDYYYLRRSERKDGKVKAVTVAYLGKNKKEAEKKAKEIERKLLDKKIVGERSGFVNKEKGKKPKVENQGMMEKKKSLQDQIHQSLP